MKIRVVRALIFFMILLCVKQADSQGFTTKGTDFWFGFLENYLSEDSMPTDQMKVYITADLQGATGTISIPLASWSQNFTVAPNSTATFILPTDLVMATETETIENKGVHVTTDNPVSVYQLNYVQYTSDGNIVIPTISLGKSYRVTTYASSEFGLYGTEITASELLIVAAYDSTYVKITPKCNTQGGHGMNIPFVIMLRQGESYQVKQYPSATYNLNGSLIELDPTVPGNNCKPFAVFAGNKCVFVPANVWACNHICEQMIPTSAWGKKYITVPLKTRTSDIFRIVAQQAGTIFTINGVTHGLNAGQSWEEELSAPAYIESSFPLSVAQFSKGGQADTNEFSDPFMIMINPLEQSIRRIVFNSFVTPIIDNYYLNIVTRTAYTSLVTLDGTSVSSSFSPVPYFPSYSYAQLTVSQGNHVLVSDSGLIANVYGYGWYESYGYIAGATVRNLEIGYTITSPEETVPYYDLVDTICRGTELTFAATINPNVINYSWNFGDGSPLDFGQTVTHTYSQPGNYVIKLYYEKVGFCASDSIIWAINIKCCNEPLVLNGPATICTGDTTTITEISTLNPQAIYTWSFDHAHLVSGTGQGPYQLYWTTPGTDTLWVHAKEPSCTADSTFIVITINPVPISTFQVESPLCQGDPSNVNFTGTASPTAIFVWDFDGANILAGTGAGPYTIKWMHGGVHNISLTVSEGGCSSTSIVPVTVFAPPLAQFTASPTVAFVEEPLIQFTDISLNTSTWMWNFGDIASGAENFSTMQSPAHNYSGQGSFLVLLTVESPNGCIDSSSMNVQVIGINSFYIPSAFTPNFDGTNEVFEPYSTQMNYTLYIYNRWGEELFVGVNKGWDGTFKGDVVKADNYVWVLIYSFYQEKEKMAKGRVTVLK